MDIHRANVEAEPESTKPKTYIYVLQSDNSANPSIHEQRALQLERNDLSESRQYFMLGLPETQNLLHSVDSLDSHSNKDQYQLINGHYQQMVKVDVVGGVSPTEEIQNIKPSIVEPDTSTSKYEIKISVGYDNHSTVPGKHNTVDKLGLGSEVNTLRDQKNHCEAQDNKNKIVENYVHIYDQKTPPRAVAVLPSILQIRNNHGILPRRSLAPRTRFGPVEGVKNKISSPAEACKLVEKAFRTKTPLFLLRDEINSISHIDVSDQDKSNWLGLLPLGNQDTANLWIYEDDSKLYAITTKYVPCRVPLRLGYSRKYAEDYGLIGQPAEDLFVIKQSGKWSCHICKKEMDSKEMFQRHMDLDHEELIVTKRKYRCGQCTMTFSRLFTLRRHKRRHCKKKPDKSISNTTTNVPPPDTSTTRINSTPNPEESRTPSDESFQNYSNGLDFSTNLFDTDRISNLDISATLRADDLNPYSLNYKDDNLLSNELGFMNNCSNGTEMIQSSLNEHPKMKRKKVEPILITCAHCNQVVLQEKKRQHLRQCVARKLECECGKVFTNKKLFTKHVYNSHPASREDQGESIDYNGCQNESKAEKAYKCDQCQSSFKRRGMLVNHLWRSHGQRAVSVPLQKRVLHYACPECPKIYRAAAKRDMHVSKYHPGSVGVRGPVLEGGVRSCEPAACPACPRQYHTRAKMLQHMRAAHPQLAPPPGTKATKTKPNRLNIEGLTEQPVDFSSSHERMF